MGRGTIVRPRDEAQAQPAKLKARIKRKIEAGKAAKKPAAPSKKK